jgi:hypothetical protein
MTIVFYRHTAGRFFTRLSHAFLLASSVALPLLPALSAPSFRADKNYWRRGRNSARSFDISTIDE